LRTIERAADAEEGLVAYMEVDIGRAGIHMPEKGLDIFDIGPAFKQVAGKTVSARMGRDTAGNTGKPGAFFKELVHTGYIQVSTSPGAWEKYPPGPAAFVPILGKKVKILPGEDGIPVDPAFGFTDMDGHVGTGNVIVMEMDSL